jgi:putative membrane-bound dehydrogenase-like protein
LAALLSVSVPPNFEQPQSPPRPAPKGLTFIDQGQFDARLKGYITPAGFRLEIVASEPTIINPVGMTFGPDGTLYVLEWRPGTQANDTWNEVKEEFIYKDGSRRLIACMKKSVSDCVKVLTDSKGRGVYDQSRIILEDELPSSILIHDGWLYLASRGSVRRYRPSKPGGPYDIKEVIAQGFCGFHHHQVSGLTIGPDGMLYITSGDDDNYVEGSDGSRVTVLRTGAVFRCRPDGSRMEIYSIGWRNPYRDLAYDANYQWFHVDNDNEDGSKFTGCRLMHVAEASDFGWRLFTGARCCRPDHVRGAVYGELPGKLPPMLKTGRGAPAGLLIYNDTQLPPAYRGLLYYPDVFRRLIRAYKVVPDGSTFAVAQEFELLKSEDPLFRPCQMVTGPDGAIYICDWRTDSGGAGKLFGDGVHGRIYRLTWAGTPDQPALARRHMNHWNELVTSLDEQLLARLASPNQTDRVRARIEIVRRGERFRPVLLELLSDERQPDAARREALNALNAFWNDDVRDAIMELLSDRELALSAVEALALNAPRGDTLTHAALLKLLNNPEPSLRRAAALGLGRVNAPGAADALVASYKFDDGQDLYLRDGLIRAIERTGPAGIQGLVDLAHSGSDRDRDLSIAAFLTLRTRAGADAVPHLLRHPHLTVDQRAALIRSLTNYLFDPPYAPDAVIDYLLTQRDEAASIKLAGLDLLTSLGSLRAPKVGALLVSYLGERDSAIRQAAIKAIEEVRLTPAAPVLVGMLKTAQRSVEERTAIIRALRVLGDKSAVPLLRALLVDKAPEADTSVRVDALRCLAALDPAAAHSVALGILEEGVPGLQSEAVQVLGNQPAGAKQVGERYLAKKLPRELLPQVSEALRKHAAIQPELAALLTNVIKGGLSVSVDPKDVERLREQVRAQGDPRRGKELYLNAKLLACVTCHKMEGVGGQIGPDLTRLWDTHSVEKIVEAIVEPSKEIKEGYQTYRAQTTDGRVIEGLKIAESPTEVVLRDPNGKDNRLPKSELDELAATKTSLMPDNAVAQLSYNQFLDLVAFLKDRPAQESLRGLVTEFWVAGPYGNDIQTAYPPEQHMNPRATDTPVAWKRVATEPDGRLDLRALLQKDRASAYALTYVFSPKAQEGRLLIGSQEFARAWVNGKLVYEHALPRKARPDDHAVKVRFEAGWNPVLVKVVNRLEAHDLYLRFDGADGLRVSLTPQTK